MAEMNKQRQHQPWKGGRKIAQDKHSAVLGKMAIIKMEPQRGVAKNLLFMRSEHSESKDLFFRRRVGSNEAATGILDLALNLYG